MRETNYSNVLKGIVFSTGKFHNCIVKGRCVSCVSCTNVKLLCDNVTPAFADKAICFNYIRNFVSLVRELQFSVPLVRLHSTFPT